MKKIYVSMVLFLVMASFVGATLAEMPIGDGARIVASFVNQDPDPVDAGEYVDARFKFENKGGGAAHDLEVELLPEYPFSLDPGRSAVQEIGSLYSRQMGDEGVIVKYKVKVDKDAIEDSYELKLRYRSGYGAWVIVDDFEVDVESKEINFQIGKLETDPLKLVADTDEAEITIELQNIGDGNAENVKTRLITPEGFESTYSYSDQSNLGSIDSGSSGSAVFYLDVDEGIDAREYDSTLFVNYKKEDDPDNEYREEEIKVKIPVKPSPLFEITEANTVPEQVSPSDDVKLLIKVKNTGSKEAESVSLRAFKESSQPFDFDEKSDFIGKLDPGESGEAILMFSVEDDAAQKNHIVDIEIRGVNDNQVQIFEKNVDIRVDGRDERLGSQMTGILITLAIVIAGIIVYRAYQKKKR